MEIRNVLLGFNICILYALKGALVALIIVVVYHDVAWSIITDINHADKMDRKIAIYIENPRSEIN